MFPIYFSISLAFTGVFFAVTLRFIRAERAREREHQLYLAEKVVQKRRFVAQIIMPTMFSFRDLNEESKEPTEEQRAAHQRAIDERRRQVEAQRETTLRRESEGGTRESGNQGRRRRS